MNGLQQLEAYLASLLKTQRKTNFRFQMVRQDTKGVANKGVSPERSLP